MTTPKSEPSELAKRIVGHVSRFYGSKPLVEIISDAGLADLEAQLAKMKEKYIDRVLICHKGHTWFWTEGSPDPMPGSCPRCQLAAAERNYKFTRETLEIEEKQSDGYRRERNEARDLLRELYQLARHQGIGFTRGHEKRIEDCLATAKGEKDG